jgi:hypothetical protein
MGPAYQVKVMFFQKAGDDIGSEDVGNSSFIVFTRLKITINYSNKIIFIKIKHHYLPNPELQAQDQPRGGRTPGPGQERRWVA